jgi:hypothetical protein
MFQNRLKYIFVFLLYLYPTYEIIFSYHPDPSTYIKQGYLMSWPHFFLEMHLFVFLLLIVACGCDVRVSVDQTGAYNISVNNQLWLRSSRTAIYVDDRWHSTENNSLPLVSITEGQGTDPYLGNWNETKVTYNLVRSQTTIPVVAHIRQWSTASAFTFHLETGDAALTSRIALDFDQVRTVFPSFRIEKIDAGDQRGYFTIAGHK